MDELSLDHLPDLVVFAKVVDLGGFTAASKALSISQATVSRRVAGLEEHLGISLLDRSTRVVSITDAGNIFYRHAKHIMDEQNAISSVLMGMAARPSGKLRVSAPVEFGRIVLTPIIIKYLSTYPDVSLKLELNQHRIDLIEQGIDVDIRVGPLEDSNLGFQKLGKMKTQLYAAPVYLEKNKPPSTPVELYNHSLCAAHLNGKPITWSLERGGEVTTVKHFPKIEASEFEFLAELACYGCGIAELPKFIGDNGVKEGRLVRILPEFTLVDDWGDITAVFPAYRGMMLSLKAFLDLLRTEVNLHFPST